MSNLLILSAILLIIATGLMLLRYGTIFWQLQQVNFQHPYYTRQPLAAVPAEIRSIFQLAIDRLSGFGFEEIDYYLVDRLDSWGQDAPARGWELLCHQPETNTYARVGIRQPLEVVDLFEVDFLTQWGDGSWSISLDSRAYSQLLRLPLAIVQDNYAGDVDIQWQNYQLLWQQLATERGRSQLSPPEFIAAFQGYQQAYLISLQQQGKLTLDDARWRLHWRTALQNTPQIDRGLRRAHRALQRRRSRQTESIEVPLALQLDSFHWMESRQMPPLGRQVKLWLLAGSLTLFILSCIQFLSPVNIAIFVGVLLLHECGHLAAMKWRGYRHHLMLFIPWLGAMVTGEKDDATVVDKTIVALSGPLPGLLLGCGLGWWTQELTNPDWLNMAIEMLIWLNALNLLPLHPLDGGQVIDVLLCSRYPYLDLAFKLGGIAFSIVVAIHQPLLLPIAGLLIPTIALSIPDSFQIARLNRRLQARLDRQIGLDREVLLSEIFTVLHRSGGHNLASSRRYLLTKKLLQRYHERGTSGLARLGLGTFYSLSLMTGLWGGLLALSSEFRRNNDFGEYSDRQSQVRVQNRLSDIEIDR